MVACHEQRSGLPANASLEAIPGPLKWAESSGVVPASVDFRNVVLTRKFRIV